MFFTGLALGRFILLTFGHHGGEFLQTFFQLFQSQFAASRPQATDIQQYFQKFVHIGYHASKILGEEIVFSIIYRGIRLQVKPAEIIN